MLISAMDHLFISTSSVIRIRVAMSSMLCFPCFSAPNARETYLLSSVDTISPIFALDTESLICLPNHSIEMKQQ